MSTQIQSTNANASAPPHSPAGCGPEIELPISLMAVVGRLEDDEAAGLVRHCFSALLNLLSELRDINAGDSAEELQHAPGVIASVGAGAFVLTEYAEEASAKCQTLTQDVEEALIGVCFALRHEVRRAVEIDFYTREGEGQAGEFQGRVAQAYNLLYNCFQQCIVLLARSIDPEFDDRELFDDARLRREQSVRLRGALVALVAAVKDAEGGRYPQSAVSLIEEIEAFRRDHMRQLMRRDWETFDGFVNEVVATREANDFTAAAKKFLAYLETLLAHVQMRAVLKEQPAAAAKASVKTYVKPAARRLPRLTLKPVAWAAAASVLLTCGLVFSSRLNAEGGVAGRVAGATHAAPTVAVAPAVGAAPSATAGADKPREEAKESTPAKASKASAVATPNDAEGRLTVQVGAYGDAASAGAAVSTLATKGVEARVERARAAGQGIVFRVQVGRFRSRGEAERFGGQLKARGAVRTYLVAESE